MVTWLGSYVYWHILHPHLKNYIKELSFYWQTLNSPEADNHLISTFCTYTNCLGLIDVLSANDRAEIAGCILLAWKPFWTYQYCQKDELWKVKSLPFCIPAARRRFPFMAKLNARRRRESSYSLTVSEYFVRPNQFSQEQNYQRPNQQVFQTSSFLRSKAVPIGNHIDHSK